MSILRKMVAAAVMISTVSMTACTRPPMNETRSTDDHKYDIMDFIEVSTFGQNGQGFIEVRPKDIKASDFDNDAEYIAVRKDLDAINPTYINKRKTNSKMNLSETKGLSNGDKIIFSFDTQNMTINSDMCFDKYQYTVSGLGDLTGIDVFDTNFLKVFALETGELYYLFDLPKTPEIIHNDIIYTLKTNDKADELEAGKTIVNVTAQAKQELLDETGYPDTEYYLAKNGIVVSSLSTDMILEEVVHPFEINSLNEEELKARLIEQLNANDYSIEKIYLVDKTEQQALNEPYSFHVVYLENVEGKKAIKEFNALIVNFHDTFYTLKTSKPTGVQRPSIYGIDADEELKEEIVEGEEEKEEAEGEETEDSEKESEDGEKSEENS